MVKIVSEDAFDSSGGSREVLARSTTIFPRVLHRFYEAV